MAIIHTFNRKGVQLYRVRMDKSGKTITMSDDHFQMVRNGVARHERQAQTGISAHSQRPGCLRSHSQSATANLNFAHCGCVGGPRVFGFASGMGACKG
jgi:hypothetical protein